MFCFCVHDRERILSEISRIIFKKALSHSFKIIPRQLILDVCWSPKCNNCPKCNEVLNVITVGPKCNKAINVPTFGPKCNKPPMQSFNYANIEMLKWQLLHMAYCGLTDINQRLAICQRRRLRSIGYKTLYWCAFGIKLTDAKEWERWSIALFISLAQTL